MILVRSIMLRAVGIITAGLLGILIVPPAHAAATAAAPAWEVFPVVGPTNLYQKTGERDEVEVIRVASDEEDEFTLSFEGNTTGKIACGASAASVQSELEALPTIGADNLQVREGVVEGGVCSDYVVTFIGALGNRSLPLMSSTTNAIVEMRTPGRGGWGKLSVYVVDEGGAPSSGTVTATVELPEGITTYETPEGTDLAQAESAGQRPGLGSQGWTCSKGAGLAVVTCTDEEPAYPGLGIGDSEFNKAWLEPIDIPLQIANTKPGEVMATVSVTGGSAAPVTVRQPITIDSAPASPGLQVFKARAYEADGSPAMRAGAHPFAITTGFFVNTIIGPSEEIVPAYEAKNIEANLPSGLIGNPQVVPKCDSHGNIEECAFHHQEAQVGVAATVTGGFGEDGSFGSEGVSSAIWSLVPEAPTPAEFGFLVAFVPVHLRARVRSDSDYGVTVSSPDTLQTRRLYGSFVTFWGKPNEPIHDEERCSFLTFGLLLGCEPTKAANTPFLTDPTDCVDQALEPPAMTMDLSFWQRPEEFTLPLSSSLASVGGCDRVPFHPSLHVIPTQHTAASPTGLLTELDMPQIDSEEGLGEADVHKAVVTLPEGMTISPAAAGGLGACSPSQIGLTGSSPVRFDEAAPSCPESSKLGTATIDTPLLPDSLKGNIYLAEQGNNPFGSLLAVYLYATDPVSGVEVKVAGSINPDPVTGRITATFDDLPQLVFGDVKLAFKSGPRAPLMTPTGCGTFFATSDLTPTSKAGAGPNGETVPGGSDAISSDSFSIEGCSTRRFAPSFVAGMTNNQAGAFSPFTLTLTRNSDEEAALSSVSMSMPRGLSGMLTRVPLCGVVQAKEGSCPASSQIGHVTVVFGDGPNPLTLPEPGKGQDPVYLTGPYEGAPFGLSIVVPAEAGPFNLGRVIVRAKVQVDPITAQVSIVSDAMPTILQGVPTDLRTVNVVIDREGFTFNPTNCNAMALAGQVGSVQGDTAGVSNRFQAANCGTLGFKPRLNVSTAGKTSRASGASLDVKLSYPKAAFGSQANIAKVKVDLPKQLPSRLTTLQKACPAATFNQNPAACPAGSRVGSATATTPIIPVALSGPAYFVSYGDAKFPELVVVLSGYGVTVQLHGETFISKAGITSSTFRQVPDVPIGSFELKLHQGSNSALAANGNLCRSKLKMPTAFTAQNGMVLHQSTVVTSTGCAKHKAKSQSKASKHKKIKAKKKK
ncbi:MAG TPA: hypothetical protein VK781_04360 [Solirubrobacteraceae bacterium]|jgi:hypothetical protein|nr:hypothetical protein [Solirubrobacteraceae bacterium]